MKLKLRETIYGIEQTELNILYILKKGLECLKDLPKVIFINIAQD